MPDGLSKNKAKNGRTRQDQQMCQCPICTKAVRDSEDSCRCDYCKEWSHVKCLKMKQTNFNAIKESGNEALWLCPECRRDFDKYGINKQGNDQINSEVSKIKNSLIEVTRKLDMVLEREEKHREREKDTKDQLQTVLQHLHIQKEDSAASFITQENLIKKIDGLENREKVSYAEKLRSDFTLVVKSTNNETKATDNKKSIVKSLKNIPVEKVKSVNGGHLLIKLRNKESMEEARAELDKLELEVAAEVKGKLQPKIMLCNVSKDDDEEDDRGVIRETIIGKNKWMAENMDKDEDFKMVAKIKARNDTCHWVFKCTPKLRKAIFEHDDYLYTCFSKHKVRDRYHVIQCYKCQKYGHMSDKCREAEQICPKCAGGHRLAECEEETKRCSNCVGRENVDSNHWANSNSCHSLLDELKRIKYRTDHGFN